MAPLGAGASAQVFLADDTTLGRQVAVKMLQPALAADEVFLDRFAAEARTVASVTHANVVVVHDSGVDGVPYLVTEYLAGGSLRGMLAAGHRLSPAQALLVGLDACRGLAHAHARGLVHRDLKPANLLFGDDGRLRIADFGLARALADAGATEHDGSLVGTMRYVSPEQALGTSAGPPADVYALALTLVEAVTGATPFATGDPRASLAARTTGDLEVPEELGPLRPALERAGRLDPDERADAEELGIALLAASERMARPDPLPLVGALAEAGATVAPDEATRVAPAPIAGPAVGAAASSAPQGAGPTGPAEGTSPGAAGGADDPPTVADGVDDDPDAPRRRRRRRTPIVVAVVLAVLLGVGGVVGAQLLRTPTAEVPEVVGRSIDDLELLAAQHDWVLDEKKTRQNGTEPGEIVATDPAAGEQLAEGGTLVVLVSEGNELTDRPDDLVGRPVAEVLVELERAGLEGEVTEVFDEEVPAGAVIGTDGDVDAELPRGSVVPLIVSLGPQPRIVPDVPAEAGVERMSGILADLGLVPVREEVFSDDLAPGKVVSLSPEPGTEVPRDSQVVVRVSKGPDLVAVPDLDGMTLDEAEAALVAAGLRLGQDCCASRGTVVGSDPPAGQRVRRGTAVNVFLAR